MHILAELSPLDPASGTRVTVRTSSVQDRNVNGLNSLRWWPAILVKPVLSMRLFDGDFSSAVDAGNANFAIALKSLEGAYPNVRRYLWQGADVKLYAGVSGQAWPWTQVFEGLVTTQGAEASKLQLTAAVDIEPFNKSVLTLSYAGTGGAEGGTDLKGKLKPWVFGAAMNVEPVLINAVDNIYQFSAYAAIKGVLTLYERGAAFGASIGDYANYAALLAASIPSGKWATCLAEGLIRLGAPQYGVITGDIEGDYQGSTYRRLTGAILTRIATHLGISSRLDSASLSALDTAVPRTTNVVITSQTTFLDLARELCLSCNAQAGVSFLGQLFATRPGIGSPVLTLDAQGKRLPPVVGAAELDVSPPYSRIEFLANRSWRVHTPDEIASYGPVPPNEIYDVMDVATVDDFKARWNGVPAETVTSDGNISLIATTDLGGKGVQVGDNSGNDYFQAPYFRSMPFDPEDLYEVGFDLEFGAAHASAVAYLGVRAEDASGANMSGDSGTYCYVAVAAFAQNGAGRKTFVGYFRGRALVGAGNNVGVPSADRAAPSPLPNNTVAIRPLELLNFPGGGAGTGRGIVKKHLVWLRKVNDATLIPTGAWVNTRSYFQDEGVTYLGRTFGSKASGNLNHTPPATATSDANWYLVADKGAAGTPGDDGFIGECQPAAAAANCSPGGTPLAGQLAALVGEVKLRIGDGIQTTGVTYALVSQTGFTGMSINSSTGAFGPPSGMGADVCKAVFEAVYNSIHYEVEYVVTKVKDGSTAVSISPIAITAVPASGTYALEAGPVNISVADGQTLTVNASVTYGPTSSGLYTAQMKFTYENVTDGGAETDFATTGSHPGTGGPANTVDPDSVNATGSLVNSLGGTKVFKIRCYIRRSAGSGTVPGGNVSGSMDASAT